MTNHPINLPDHAIARLPLKPGEKWARCKFCGAKLRRDVLGQRCPTHNCQWEHCVPVANGEKLLIVVPVKPPWKIRNLCDVRWLDAADDPEIYGAGGVWAPLICPYRPGDVLVWKCHTCRATGRIGGIDRCSTCDAAGEICLTVQHIEARQMQTLTADEIEATGIDVASKLPVMLPPKANVDGLCAKIAQDLMEAHWNATYAHLGLEYAWERAWVWLYHVAAEAAGGDE